MKRATWWMGCLAAAAMAGSAAGTEITPGQAGEAARNWVERGYALGKIPPGRNVAGVDELTEPESGARLQVVRFEGGGFVVMSSDDRVDPILAFSGTGDLLVPDEGNPFWVLLRSDIAARESASGVERGPDGQREASLAPRSAKGPGKQTEAARRRWASLLEKGDSSGTGRKRSVSGAEGMPSDIRVDSLLETRWSQDSWFFPHGWDGEQVYVENYYTPNHYPCGCTATAIGQIMYHWKYPTGAVVPKTYPCRVDGDPISKTMMGGVYDWTNMPLGPFGGNVHPSEAQCQAIGKLLYDIGVAVEMSWRYGSSGANLERAGSLALRSDFGFANAIALVYSEWEGGYHWSLDEFKKAVIPNLDARCPVALHIEDRNFAHSVVADGYGFSGGDFFVHVNFGWEGDSDAWYCPPDIGEFTSIGTMLCNVHPTASGNFLSGRVLDSRKVPVENASVSLARGNSILATTTTDRNGIYAFISEQTGSLTVKASHSNLAGSARATLAESVSYVTGTHADMVWNHTCSIGNSCGNDIVLPGEVTRIVAVTLDDQGGRGGSGGVDATFGSPLPDVAVPSRSKYVFGGYYSAANGGGTQYYTSEGKGIREWDIVGDATLYAHWKATCRVTLNAQGGTGGTASVTAIEGDAMPDITTPTRTGYSFEGYYTAKNGEGTPYYTSEGKSDRAWDKTKATTLYAKWTANCYTVLLDAQGGVGGTPSVAATYGESMPDIEAPVREGFDFCGYYAGRNGTKTRYYAATGEGCRSWNKAGNTRLYAHWGERLTVWRFYSKAYKGHFFTISEEEKDGLIEGNPNWAFEGGAYRAFTGEAAGTVALYRFYSKNYRGHFFTIDEAEKDTIVASNRNWNYEGVAYYVYPEKTAGTVAVFRFWSKKYRHHFYTIDEAEKADLEEHNPNWKYEGVAFYALALEEEAAAAGARERAVKSEKRKEKRGMGEGGVVVTTSDGTDGSAVADGDEGTGWSPEAAGAGWVALSLEEPVEVGGVEVVGEMPEGWRVLLSEDAEEWGEEMPCAARYVWVSWPEGAPVVREVRCAWRAK